MTNQICYTLTSSGNDIYANMNLISIWSLRRSNPNISISLLCDDKTLNALNDIKHLILNNVDNIIQVRTPGGSNSYRNRYIKTSVRQHMKGPFLYLDADTLIRGDLSPIFNSASYFSATPNHSGTGNSLEIPKSELDLLQQMDWPVPIKYINGGVLYFADHPSVYKFSEKWHEKWKFFHSRTGKYNDQVALNSSLNESSIDFQWMSSRYNAQINARPSSAKNAIIWHIYHSGKNKQPITVMDTALKIFNNRLECHKKILSLTQNKLPWKINNAIDVIAIRCICRNNKLLSHNNWAALWLSDNYIGAFKIMTKGIFPKMKLLEK